MRRRVSCVAALAWLALSVSACTQVLGDFTESSTGSGSTASANESCEDCGNRATAGTCSGPVNACNNSQACLEVVGCATGCPPGDNPCLKDCYARSPAGVKDFLDFVGCVCHACTMCDGC